MKRRIAFLAVALAAVAAPVAARSFISYQNDTTGLYCGDGHQTQIHWIMKGYELGTDEWQETFTDSTYAGVFAQCVSWADQN